MPSYNDIDDILMEEESITVVFQVGANGVGLLDPSSETVYVGILVIGISFHNCCLILFIQVEQGAKVDIPFWLAHELYLRQAVSINVPACFNQKTRKEIQADAACVNLRFCCPYFYELGCKIVPLVADKTIGSFIHYAFTSRYKEILSKSHSTPGATVPKFLPLTKEEAKMFEAARSSMAAFKKWRVGGSRLERAAILGRKRKTTTPIPPPSTP